MKKFFLYVFVFICIVGLIIGSVDYPHEHEAKLAKETAIQPKQKVTVRKITEDVTDTAESFSEEVTNFADSLNDLVATVRDLKQGLKTVKCGGKLVLRLWKIDRRIDNLPEDLLQEVFVEEGFRLENFDLFDFDGRESPTDEQLKADYQARIDAVFERYDADPSQINTRKALSVCSSTRLGVECSEEQISQLHDNLDDSFGSWMTKIDNAANNDYETIGRLMDMALTAPSNTRLYEDHVLSRYALAMQITNDPALSLNISRFSNITNSYQTSNIARFCRSELRDSRCEALGHRLIDTTYLHNHDWTGYTILKSYYKAEGNEEAIEQLELKREQVKSTQPKDWPFLDDEYAEQYIQNMRDFDHATALSYAAEDARQRFDADPGLCVM